MKSKIALLSLATAAVLASPVVAHAGTKASASTGKISSLSGAGERKSAAVKPSQNVEAAVLGLAILGAGAATYGVVEATDNNKSNGS